MKKILLSLLILIPALTAFSQTIVPREFDVYYRVYQTGPSWAIEISPEGVLEMQAAGYQPVFNRSSSSAPIYTNYVSYAVYAGVMPPPAHRVPPGDEENVFIQINSLGDGFWGKFDPIGQPYP